MVDQLDGLLVWVLQEAAPKVHLCSHQLELGYNTSGCNQECQHFFSDALHIYHQCQLVVLHGVGAQGHLDGSKSLGTDGATVGSDGEFLGFCCGYFCINP